MYCPYCGEDLILEKNDFYIKPVPCKKVKGWNFLQKLFAGLKNVFQVECIICPSCKKEIQLREMEEGWYNYPIWEREYEFIDYPDGVKNDNKN